MTSPWDIPDLNTRLLKLHAAPQMYSNGAIARMLSREFEVTVTRNAVIGKVARLGLAHRVGASKGGGGSNRPQKVKAKPVPKPVRAPPVVPRIPVKRPGNIGNVSLLALRDDDCLWPFGDGPSYTFCGQPCVPGHPYCEEHFRIAHNEPRERRT